MTFKECPNCHYNWPDRYTFLADPKTQLVGYQANFGNLLAGFFLFQHNIPECGTSLAVPAEAFKDMHDGPIFRERKTGSPECPGYCLHSSSTDPCKNACECAYVRDVLQKVKQWPKGKLLKTA